MTKKHFFQAFKTSIPVLFGYLAIGIAFGLMLVDKKYPIWLAPIMSTLMYAGAGQYIAIGLFAVVAQLIGTPSSNVCLGFKFDNILFQVQRCYTHLQI